MTVSQHERSFQLSSRLISLCPITKAYDAFNSRALLPSDSEHLERMAIPCVILEAPRVSMINIHRAVTHSWH